MINIVSTIATVLSVGGNFLLAKKNKLVFPMWIVANIMWIGIVYVQSCNLSMMAMYFIYIGTSAYSWISWNKEEEK